MGIILSLALLLFLAIAFKLAFFVLTCLVLAFKVFVVGAVGFLLWKCFKTFLNAGN